jgi:hypothetical protein
MILSTFMESEGCLVALAVFKTAAGSLAGRGRFDSYPLRHRAVVAPLRAS